MRRRCGDRRRQEAFRRVFLPRIGRRRLRPRQIQRRFRGRSTRCLGAIDPAGLGKAALASCAGRGALRRDRADRIARASAALAEAEIAEEIALRQLDQLLGRHEPRRPDADPGSCWRPSTSCGPRAGRSRAVSSARLHDEFVQPPSSGCCASPLTCRSSRSSSAGNSLRIRAGRL